VDLIPVIKPWLGPDEAKAVADVIKSGWVAQGPRVAEFERAVAEYTGAEHGVAASSCTAGLHLVLHAIGIGPGDEVVVPSLSFIASANAPRYVGGVPVFADVDGTTLNLTPESIEPVLTERTRAVVLVHQLGMPADIDGVRSLCEPRGIVVVEDAACAIGSTYKGRRIGSHSRHVVFSFHPRKLLTTGEGGMIMTSDEATAVRLRALRQHGMDHSAFDRHLAGGPVFEHYAEMGFNFRMTDMQAAVGLVQLSKLDEMVARRRELADAYGERLGDLGLCLPGDPEYGRTNYQSYSVVLEPDAPVSRDELMAHLEVRGVSPRRGVMAAHREQAFAGYGTADLPVTDFVTDHSLILPMYHEMTEHDLDRVVTALVEVLT